MRLHKICWTTLYMYVHVVDMPHGENENNIQSNVKIT